MSALSASQSYTERLTGAQREYAELANSHLQHDLTDSDRDLLEKAAKKFSLHTGIGASIGLGLGLFLTFRMRRAGQAIYNAAKRIEKPTAIQFADGHTVPFPDTSEYFKPSTFSQVLMGSLFSIAGFFVGGEIGMLTGASSAKRTITSDPTSRGRIEQAFKKFRVDVLRKQADDLERQGNGEGRLL